MNALPLSTVFARAVAREPEALAIVDGETRLTYAQWDAEIARLAGGLAAMGIGQGDAVLLVLSNRYEMASLFWACHRIGALFVPFNWRGTADDFAYVIEDAEAKVFVYERRSEASAREALGKTGFDVGRTIRVGEAGGEGPNYETLVQSAPDAGETSVDPEAPCLMLYTSGTTGRPKGVPRSHTAERNASFNCVAQLHYAYGEIQLGVMPLFHTMGVRALEMATALNGAFVCMPAFDAGEALQLIGRERIEALFLVPTMFHDMVNHPDLASADLRSIKHMGYAGMSMTSALTKRCAELFEPEAFMNFYGSSEIYCFAVCDHVAEKPGCAGRAGLGQALRVVEADPDFKTGPDRILSQGEIGEVIAPMEGLDAFGGYWKRPDADAKAIRAGWYFTGDLGYFDEDGELFLVGRVDDMIISGGENIHPEEVEDVLDAMPMVKQAAVIGMPDDRMGSKVVAFIEPASDQASAAALDAACLDSDLARFKRPREYVFVEAIPRSASGKLLRRFLRDGAYTVLPDHDTKI